jgi:hypothetical protein
MADLSHVEIAFTLELNINVEKYSSEKHTRSDVPLIHCFWGGLNIPPPITPESTVFPGKTLAGARARETGFRQINFFELPRFF